MNLERKFECADCGAVPDCPQLKNEVWYRIAGPDDLLCLGHAEARLGRDIVPGDLADCAANSYALKLAERML